MVIKICAGHPVFKSRPYQKDIVSFHIVEGIKANVPLIMSDEQSFIICSSLMPTVPAWVWTDDNIGERELAEAYRCYKENFIVDAQAYFVAKPETASEISRMLSEEGYLLRRCIKMQSYECPRLVPAKNRYVRIGRPSEEDLERIADFCRNFALDCFGSEISRENALDKARDFLNASKSFVIRDEGRAVAMAKNAFEAEKYVGINDVYTLPEYRGRGFASALVAHISGLILAEGKIPQLYTDLSNPASNKAYINVGFIKSGRVDETRLVLKR